MNCPSKTSPDCHSVPHWTCGLCRWFCIKNSGPPENGCQEAGQALIWSLWQRSLLILWLSPYLVAAVSREKHTGGTKLQSQANFFSTSQWWEKSIAENTSPSGAKQNKTTWWLDWVHGVSELIVSLSTCWASSKVKWDRQGPHYGERAFWLERQAVDRFAYNNNVE